VGRGLAAPAVSHSGLAPNPKQEAWRNGLGWMLLCSEQDALLLLATNIMCHMPYRFLPFPFPVTLRDIESRSRVATLFKMQQFVEHCAAAHCKFLIDTARRAIPLR